ncbi:MAG: stage II sporulation protein R [Ruminiclostridium sp.]|nr:stage II sporulation protein R [Ruminiclostridium sp.]
MMRVIGSSRRLGNALKIGITFVITASIVAGILLGSYSEEVNKGLADSLIRLHVIANSDSPADQELKRDVRDKVMEYMKLQLGASKNVDQTRIIIKENIDKLKAVIKDEIIRQGWDYDVRISLGSYPFPTKSYGDIALPAGNYEALRVVIGKGEGANWWCVIFPPLCFVDVTHGTVPEPVKEDLKKALTKDEYNLIVSADTDDEIPIRIKFKIVEFFQDSKIKFTGLIAKIFSTSK